MSDGSHGAHGDAPTDRRGVELLEAIVRNSLGVRRPERSRRTVWRTIVPGVLAAVLAVGLGVLWVRRPVPVEAQLPMAAPAAPRSGPDGSVSPSSTVPGGGPVVVHVAGAVARPGLVTLTSGGRVADAVAAAGGLRSDADPDRLNLAAPVRDGDRVAVPVLGQPALAPVTGAGSADDGPGGPSGPVDLNTADAAALEELPGVGPATAAAIVAHRDTSGPFGSVDDLLDVRGIGEAKLEALRDAVTVGP